MCGWLFVAKAFFCYCNHKNSHKNGNNGQNATMASCLCKCKGHETPNCHF
ncbi:hypothetical protein Glove_522g91 [Diversispora epigaea]|uniref:Uncharacterized protein n=1 Tax=Diversispora epigaea TaxID=1348612 RepID=A0A397GHZ7_9GLOM|nr:hypothetical protein Glove_522g91 [Diversispora epigaea]